MSILLVGLCIEVVSPAVGSWRAILGTCVIASGLQRRKCVGREGGRRRERARETKREREKEREGERERKKYR